MAKRKGTATFVPPGTDLADARERNRGGIQAEGRGTISRAEGFAEDLGRLLGTAQVKAQDWLGQRKAIAEQLTQIRDAATRYLQQLAGAEEPAVRRDRKPGRSAGFRNKRSKIKQAAATSGTGKRKRKGMTAAQRKAVGLRMKKYWADRRKTAGK
jgi:hypothetical protein